MIWSRVVRDVQRNAYKEEGGGLRKRLAKLYESAQFPYIIDLQLFQNLGSSPTCREFTVINVAVRNRAEVRDGIKASSLKKPLIT